MSLPVSRSGSIPARVACAAVALAALAGVGCSKKASEEAKPAAPGSGEAPAPGSGSAAAPSTAPPAPPAEKTTIKIGMIAPFSGPFADSGQQLMGGIKAYIKQNGDTVAGKKVEILTRDTTGPAAEIAKRLAQELVVQDKVDFLVGFALTPEALAAAPVATEGKTPMVIMNAATSIITTKSPYVVRFSLTLPQVSAPLGDWAAKNGIKKVATMVADYGPGHDAEAAFAKAFTAGGGQIVDEIRTPLNNPDFSSFVQRVKDKKPDAMFVFVPAGQQSIGSMKAYAERGLAKAGIKLIATGDMLEDHSLATIGDAALGVITTHHYSVAHDSPENKAFLAAYREANGAEAGLPNFMSVGAYDGMAAIYEVAKKLEGKIDPDKAMELLKHMSFTSPRGPISIDPETRDIVQTVYLRKVEKVNGELRHVEIAQFANQKDPGK
jgi:branched-chain amino acid transport system substrate-binding protein